MNRYIALLRGINVGTAKRIAMLELRELFTDLGYSDVATLLNSGNVIFCSDESDTRAISSSIQDAILERFLFPVRTIVVSSSDLATIISKDPFTKLALDPSRYLIGFVSDPKVLSLCTSLENDSWSPEALSIGSKAAYIWCANGIIESSLMKSLSRIAKDSITTRNLATVLKLQAKAEIQS